MRRVAAVLLLLATAVLAQPATVRQFICRYEPVRKDFTLQNATEAERPVLVQHGAYLKSLLDSGKLVLAGQAFDPNGLWGIAIVSAEDVDVAKALVEADPAVQSKFFKATVVPFRVVFAKGAAAGSR